MYNYLLENYHLSGKEIVQSLFLSEYGLRHFDYARRENQYSKAHFAIAVVELLPIIGLITTVFEVIIVKCIKKFFGCVTFFTGSQEGNVGKVCCHKVEAIRKQLQEKSAPGVIFNSKKVEDSNAGGTCSAMSLEFADSYFRCRELCVKSSDSTSRMLLQEIKKIGSQFASSSEEMRTRQAAYNTIEVDKKMENVDYSKNKIQSLASFHDFSIGYSSKEIDVKSRSCKDDLVSEVDSLPEGVYLLRTLMPLDNEKLESHGHSMIYIKDKNVSLFYDPNPGLKYLFKSRHASVLFDSLKDCLLKFETNKARFYQLVPERK